VSHAGILGCGVISDVYARKLSALPFVELVACADLQRDRAERLAGENAIPRVLDPEELIADPDLDVVVNLTIPAAQFELSLAAIEAGKSVYSEKPLAMDVAQGRALAEAALAQGVRLGCAPDTFLGGDCRPAGSSSTRGRSESRSPPAPS
jgi:predicted dehydrogenase